MMATLFGRCGDQEAALRSRRQATRKATTCFQVMALASGSVTVMRQLASVPPSCRIAVAMASAHLFAFG